jgi:hypothetical protein
MPFSDDPYGLSGDYQQPQPKSHFSVGKLLGGLALGAGGAYAYGKYGKGGNNFLTPFTQGMDTRVINPLIKKLTPKSTLYAQQLTKDVDNDILQAQLKERLYNPVTGKLWAGRAQGTAYEGIADPSKINNVVGSISKGTSIASAPMLLGNLANTAYQGIHGGIAHIAPSLATKMPQSILPKILQVNPITAGAVGSVMTMPSAMQVGDKISDHFGINNTYGRAGIKALAGAANTGATVLTGLGGTAVSGPVGGAVGSIVGANAMPWANRWGNERNRYILEQIAAKASANSLTTRFQNTLANNDQAQLKGWYKALGPAGVSHIVNTLKNNPELRQSILAHNPYGN